MFPSGCYIFRGKLNILCSWYKNIHVMASLPLSPKVELAPHAFGVKTRVLGV